MMRAMINIPLKNKPRSRSSIIAVLVLVVLLPAWWRIGLWHQERLLADMRGRITGMVKMHANSLSAAVNQRLILLRGLQAFVEMHITSRGEIDPAKFALFAARLCAGTTGIRSVTIAPSGITLFVYPAEGNENLAGQDLLRDRRGQIRTDFQRIIRSRKIALSGPYTLRQKGLQLVARQALYDGETFWGLITLDCDISPAFVEAALEPPPAGLDLILQDRTGHLLIGKKTVLELDPVFGNVEIPDGAWKLAIAPAGGWNASIEKSLLEFRGITLAIVLMVTFLIYHLISYRARLKLAVQERTTDLQRSLTSHREEEENLSRSLGTLRRAMRATLEVQARAVEMKDPYASGHQRRVADLARTIAMEMGHPEEVIDGIRMGAVVHDIGKLLMPAEILNKPAKLNEIEFNQIKKHAQAGYDILKDIEFPWPIARMVWQHHERVDGSGYPLGLAGEEILPEARILAVADVVETMASHRSYRPAPGLEKALEEIRANRGTLYDPAVVDACIRIFTEKDFRLA